jgi:hypothetical protein
MSKRKIGSYSPTNLTPHKKKTRVVPAATLHQWTAQGFMHMVYTPPASSLPSPFATNFQLDQHIKDNIVQFGPALQTIYEATHTAAAAGARELIRALCDDEHIAWIDPLQPIVLKAGEGLSLQVYLLLDHARTVADIPRSQGDHKKIIRFRRTISEYAIQWFAFVQRDTQLVVNGQRYPRNHDLVIGPLPSFSIVEYHDRAVFLCLNPQSVDYMPGDLDYQPTINRIVGSFSKEQGSKGKDAAALPSADTVDTRATVRMEPEIQPDDSDSCEYFNWRLREWKILQERSGVKLSDPIPAAIHDRHAEWLYDSNIYRAIASVTTAIGVEQDIDFAMIDEEGYRKARDFTVKVDENNPLITTGRNGELFLPYNTTIVGGMHWVLLHVKYPNEVPEIHVYDTLDMVKGSEPRVKRTVINTALYDDPFFVADDLDNIDLIHHDIPRQPGGWECGYFTILNAWCLALGMEPNTKTHKAGSPAGLTDLIDMINLAIAGFMDSATIQSFMRCVGFVDPDHDTIAPDRHFTRTVPFLARTSVNRYIIERREIEQNPSSAVRRLDLGNIRFLLDSTNPGALGNLNKLSTEAILQHFQQWLKERNLVDPTMPPSPTSPATIRLTTLGSTAWLIPSKIPDDVRVLRQIWDIYHATLKQKGYLGQARQERARDLANGAFSTQEIASSASYPYGDPKIVALERLDMLPTTHTLTLEEREGLRSASKPRVKLMFSKGR